jgi:NDP-sugar pyrophosphorylase family protein
MVPVINRPAIEHSVRLLRNHGITDIVLSIYALLKTSRTTSETDQNLESGFHIQLKRSHSEQPAVSEKPWVTPLKHLLY